MPVATIAVLSTVVSLLTATTIDVSTNLRPHANSRLSTYELYEVFVNVIMHVCSWQIVSFDVLASALLQRTAISGTVSS